ncbi:SDR family NAD(P)-dependent oxidoreductase [Psychrobacillus sp. NPDC096426]|uniref:SDR family NAD(P)-dependent oxidoreductase n=1 Tax=Psychrobacillus sp. NPDC096426 TaxID=3364491 RepID=UPI0038183D44
MGKLDGKVAIITGAASGQGAAEAHLFAKEGAKVVATDLNYELLTKTVKSINEEAGSEVVLGLKHNVALEDDWKKVVEEAVKHFEKVDILVNNAGVSGKIPKNAGTDDAVPSIFDYSVDEFKALMDINTTGNFIGLQTVVPEMQKNGGGSIVNISSIAALVGGQGNIAYHTSKGATRIMSKAAAVELAGYGIRVNSVYPGAVKTPMIASLGEEALSVVANTIPLKKIGTPEDIAYLVLFLASDEAQFITGAEVVADGGTTAR